LSEESKMPSGKRWSWGLFADNLWPAVFAGLVTPVVHANRGALDSVDLEETAGTPFHRTPWYLQAARASQAKFDEVLSKQEPTARLLCVVGGTGFAPVKSPLDDMGKNRPKRPVTLVWSGRNRKSPWIGRGASEGSTLGGGL
jgi:hypothetical protein